MTRDEDTVAITFHISLFLFFSALQAGRTKRDEDAVAKEKTTVLRW